MVGNQEISEIVDMDIILMLGIYAKTRYFLNRKRLGIDKGVAIVLESPQRADEVILTLVECVSAVVIKNLETSTDFISNDAIALHILHKYDKKEVLIHFLESDDFFPVLVVQDFIPEFIRDFTHIMRMSRIHNEDLNTPDVKSNLKAMIKFMMDNYEIVKSVLKIYKTSEFYSQNVSKRFVIGLVGALQVYTCWYRNLHSEKETNQMTKRMSKIVNELAKQTEALRESSDTLEVIRYLMFEYLHSRPEIKVGDIKKVEDALQMAVEAGAAILYDEEYYFVPEKMFRDICLPILHTVGLSTVKQELFENGMIECYGTSMRNFTVKKMYVNVYGKVQRGRFIKFHKSFLRTPEGVRIEDTREGEGGCLCMLGKLEIRQ